MHANRGCEGQQLPWSGAQGAAGQLPGDSQGLSWSPARSRAAGNTGAASSPGIRHLPGYVDGQRPGWDMGAQVGLAQCDP